MRKLVISMVLPATALATVTVPRAETVEGRWLTEPKTGAVEIYRCAGDTLCGRLLWLRLRPSDNNPQALDLRNSTPGLRNRPLCGLVMMWGLQPDGLNQWSGGSLYDPESGNTYSGKMTLKPDSTLSLRGYIGISLFGRSQDWTRYIGTVPRCPPE
jgi:uncharacterized protein (DUF2147 family)